MNWINGSALFLVSQKGLPLSISFINVISKKWNIQALIVSSDPNQVKWVELCNKKHCRFGTRPTNCFSFICRVFIWRKFNKKSKQYLELIALNYKK